MPTLRNDANLFLFFQKRKMKINRRGRRNGVTKCHSEHNEDHVNLHSSLFCAVRYLWTEAGETLTFSLALNDERTACRTNRAFRIDRREHRGVRYIFFSPFFLRDVFYSGPDRSSRANLSTQRAPTIFHDWSPAWQTREYCTRDNRNYISVRSSVLCTAVVFFFFCVKYPRGTIGSNLLEEGRGGG